MAVCALFLFLMVSGFGLKSVIMAFPSNTQLQWVNADFFLFSSSTSQAVSLKVDQSASNLKLL